MKKIYVLYILLIFAFTGKTQITYSNYLDSTVEWRSYGTAWDGVNSHVSYETTYFDGDTLINGIFYYKEYRKYNDTIHLWNGSITVDTNTYIQNEFIREDSTKKFYSYNALTNTETITWDWQNFLNLQVNDPFPMVGANCTIQSIDTLIFENKLLKKWDGPLLANYNSILEGVGQLGSICATGIEGDGYVACFSKQNNILQLSNINCNLFPVPIRQNHMTSIKENALNNNVSVYPNPAKDILTIETNSNKEQRLEIINLIGQTVYTIYINKKATINTSAFANGVYILKLSSNKETIVKKFIKQ